MAGFSSGLYYIGISMNYLYLLMGVLVSSAVVPITLTLVWKKMNKYAATMSPIMGFAVAVGSWLGTAKQQYGVLTVESTGAKIPMLVGNLVALLSPVIFVGIFTYLKPDDYPFESLRAIELDEDEADQLPASGQLQATRPSVSRIRRDLDQIEASQLEGASLIARCLAAFLTVALLVLWPIPLYGSSYIFSLNFFTGWVVVGIIWIFLSFFA
jgi:Na+/proline symporter